MENMNLTRTDNIIMLSGVTLLAFLFALFLTECLCFMAGLRPGAWVLPVSFGLACGLSFVISAGWRRALGAVGLSAAVIVLSAWICYQLYDTAFDSIGYHYNTVVMIDRGWNPYREYAWNDSLWSMHYAKGLEVMQAAVLSFTGNLQTVRCVNLIFILSAAFIGWHALSLAVPSAGRKWRMAVLSVAVCTPVVISQMLSAMNDYALWVETMLLASCFVMMWKRPAEWLPYLLVFFTVAIGINTKFTHFFYIGLECLFFALWCAVYRRWPILGRGCVAVGAAILAGVLLGYNPYVINTLDYGSPVYPLGGSAHTVDIMSGNTPDIYLGDNRFVNFAKSLLSVADSPWALLNGNITAGGILRSYSQDMAVNGFGVFMPLMMLLGVALMWMVRAKTRWWVLYLFVLGMALCFEQSWWARYIPFLWMLVVLPLILALDSERFHHRPVHCAAVVLTALALVNGVLSLGAALSSRLSYTAYINYVFDSHAVIRVTPLTYGLRQQFDERGVRYNECLNADSLDYSSGEYFLIFGTNSSMEHIMQLPAAEFSRLYPDTHEALPFYVRVDDRRL